MLHCRKNPYTVTRDADDSMLFMPQRLVYDLPIALKVEATTPPDEKRKRENRGNGEQNDSVLRKGKNRSNGEKNDSVLRKRKLPEEQAAMLELSFECDQKLETDRKERLAAELGLEPRQVAVWFQNRRARFKFQKMEDEFAILKSSHDNALAQKTLLESKVFVLSEKLEDAEMELARLALSTWDGEISRVSSAPLTSFFSVNDHVIDESHIEQDYNPYMGWMEGLAT